MKRSEENAVMTKKEWIRKYSYLPYKFKSCTEQTWAKIKSNALAILRKNFPDAKFRVYKYAETSMEIMFDGPQSKEEIYGELGHFATMHYCSAGYEYEFWHDWNFMFGGVKGVFIVKRGEDITYYEPKPKKAKKSKNNH